MRFRLYRAGKRQEALNSNKKWKCQESLGKNVQFSASSRAIFVALTLTSLFAVLPASARQALGLAGLQVSPSVEQLASAATDGLQSDQKSATRISGKVVDPSGIGVAGAQVRLTGDNPSLTQQVFTADDGQFAFTNVAPGAFHLIITAAAFASQEFSGNVRSGESYAVPQISLTIASVVTEVRVVPPSLEEQAEAEINEELKQRPLGFIPNFYVSYVADAAPLSPRQKFKLAWNRWWTQ